MIKTFVNKALAELFMEGVSAGIDKRMHKRILVRLDVLNSSAALNQLNLPGYNFHALHGVPRRYSIHVNGPWCITFEYQDGDAHRVDFEQYH